MPIHANFFRHVVLTHKVGQSDLVSGVPSGFISRYVQARLQVAVCSGYDLINIQDTRTQTPLWPAYMNSSASYTFKTKLQITTDVYKQN